MSAPAIRSQSTCRRPFRAEPEGEDIPLDIVYEDDDIIVIDKPKGLVVHPAAGHETGTLVNALIAHCGASLSGIGGVRRPGIVHRLDKDTTGLMVVAKNDAAHQSLSAQFADHGRTGALRRGYLAFAWGVPNRVRGTVDAPIDRHPHAREKMAVREGGREAITHWEVQETFNGRDGNAIASLLACELETGRTHQIRVHLAHIGHPLLGDDVYGAGLQDQGDSAGPQGPGGPDRPRPPGTACIPPGHRAPPNRGDVALGEPRCRRICFSCKTPCARRSDAGPSGKALTLQQFNPPHGNVTQHILPFWPRLVYVARALNIQRGTSQRLRL